MALQGGSSSEVQEAYTIEVHVLLVHGDGHILSTMRKVLEWISCKVTTAECGGKAMFILSRRNHNIDVVIADVDLPDMDGFELLNRTVKMKMTTILMSLTKHDNELAARAIRNDALMFLKSPITTETLQYLWQHVMREKLKNPKPETKSTITVNRKTSTIWTPELIDKFWKAIDELGEGKCFPKNIQEKMNVEGLTREHISSFLQRVRNKCFQVPASTERDAGSSLSGGKRVRVRDFGLKPRVVTSGSSSNTPICNINDANRENNSCSHQTRVDVEHIPVYNRATMPQLVVDNATNGVYDQIANFTGVGTGMSNMFHGVDMHSYRNIIYPHNNTPPPQFVAVDTGIGSYNQMPNIIPNNTTPTSLGFSQISPHCSAFNTTKSYDFQLPKPEILSSEFNFSGTDIAMTYPFGSTSETLRSPQESLSNLSDDAYVQSFLQPTQDVGDHEKHLEQDGDQALLLAKNEKGKSLLVDSEMEKMENKRKAKSYDNMFMGSAFKSVGSGSNRPDTHSN